MIATIRKAIAAGVLAAGGIAVQVSKDGAVSQEDALGIASAFAIAAIGTYLIPNRPGDIDTPEHDLGDPADDGNQA